MVAPCYNKVSWTCTFSQHDHSVGENFQEHNISIKKTIRKAKISKDTRKSKLTQRTSLLCKLEYYIIHVIVIPAELSFGVIHSHTAFPYTNVRNVGVNNYMGNRIYIKRNVQHWKKSCKNLCHEKCISRHEQGLNMEYGASCSWKALLDFAVDFESRFIPLNANISNFYHHEWGWRDKATGQRGLIHQTPLQLEGCADKLRKLKLKERRRNWNWNC